jgi:hypothetical protein
MPEQAKFNSPWNVANIEAVLNDVSTAKGDSDTLTEKIAEMDTEISGKADASALSPTTYTAPELTNNTNFTLQCGGYIKIGKLVVVNFRLVISGTNTITNSSGAIATGFPAPLYQPVASGVTIGGESQLVSVSCSPSVGGVMHDAALAILGNGNLIVASGSIETTTFTVFNMSAAYICQ